MGAPGYTRFCENGHIVEVVMHHEISPYGYMSDAEIPPCVCGSKKFRILTEWGDPDYHDNGGDGPVPDKVIGTDEFVSDRKVTVVVNKDTQNERKVTGNLVVEVDRYDVSKLFEEELEFEEDK